MKVCPLLCSSYTWIPSLVFIVFNVAENFSRDLPWGALDDVVMGGVSESTFVIDASGGENGGPTGIFKGLFLSDS